jgi:hypothetical protein
VKKLYGISNILDLRFDYLKETKYTKEAVIEIILNFFLSDIFILLDKVYFSIYQLIKEATSNKYGVIYLTGRHHEPSGDSMKYGTRFMLEYYRLIPETFQGLIMKPSRKMNDIDFKLEAVEKILNEYTIVKIFDDDPNNCKALKKKFPALPVYGVVTTHRYEDFKNILEDKYILKSYD